MRTQGGIGSSAEPVEVVEDALGPELAEAEEVRQPPMNAAPPMRSPQADHFHTLIETQAATIAELRRDLDHLQGRMVQVDMALPQYTQWIQTLDARLTAVAQQVVRNMRFAALELAVGKKGPGDAPKNVIEWANHYLAFLDPPAPPPEDAVSNQAAERSIIN